MSFDPQHSRGYPGDDQPSLFDAPGPISPVENEDGAASLATPEPLSPGGDPDSSSRPLDDSTAAQPSAGDLAWTEATAPWGTHYRWRLHPDRLREHYVSRPDPRHGLHEPPWKAWEVEYFADCQGWCETRNHDRRIKLWDHLVREHLLPDEIRVERPGGDEG